ncbi:hypothetical protein MASR1M32_09350 [Rhodobacter sp.]
MLSLGFGLAAALCWALHDLLVRKLTHQSAMLPMLLTVLAAGSLALALPTLLIGGWERMTGPAVFLAVLAGGCMSQPRAGFIRR